ncbi:MAG: hypothetical protein QM764_14030 [Chitinophagaceae bacterium]
MKRILNIIIATTLVLTIGNVHGQNSTGMPAGNIGIGTASPQAPLHVYTSGSSMAIFKANTVANSMITIQNNTGQLNLGIGNSTPHPYVWSGTDNFFIGSDGAPTLFINGMASGKVGIGTSAPSNLLQVHNTNVPANTIGSTTEIANFSGSTPNGGNFKFMFKRHTVGNSWENVGARLQFITDVTPQGYLEFNPKGGQDGVAFGGSYGEIMRLQSNGSVGIGTTAPAQLLDVRGNIYTNSNVIIDGGDLVLKRTTATDGYVVRPNVAGYKRLQFAVEGGGPLELLTSHAATSYFTGNVGIGTSNPGSYGLAVEGTIGARKIKVTTSPFADYVFDKDYRLPTLEEVEQYINSNHHLPEMPTTCEVEKDGLDIGDNQVLLVKKVEELTLYAIGQNKKIDLQNQKLDDQQKKIDQQSEQIADLKKLLKQLLEQGEKQKGSH